MLEKINCKHGLSPKEEIEVRRLKRSVLDGNEEVFKERIIELYKTYIINMNGGFYEYILKNDKILYSVFERIGGIKEMYCYLNKYDLI